MDKNPFSHQGGFSLDGEVNKTAGTPSDKGTNTSAQNRQGSSSETGNNIINDLESLQDKYSPNNVTYSQISLEDAMLGILEPPAPKKEEEVQQPDAVAALLADIDRLMTSREERENESQENSFLDTQAFVSQFIGDSAEGDELPQDISPDCDNLNTQDSDSQIEVTSQNDNTDESILPDCDNLNTQDSDSQIEVDSQNDNTDESNSPDCDNLNTQNSDSQVEVDSPNENTDESTLPDCENLNTQNSDSQIEVDSQNENTDENISPDHENLNTQDSDSQIEVDSQNNNTDENISPDCENLNTQDSDSQIEVTSQNDNTDEVSSSDCDNLNTQDSDSQIEVDSQNENAEESFSLNMQEEFEEVPVQDVQGDENADSGASAFFSFDDVQNSVKAQMHPEIQNEESESDSSNEAVQEVFPNATFYQNEEAPQSNLVLINGSKPPEQEKADSQNEDNSDEGAQENSEETLEETSDDEYTSPEQRDSILKILKDSLNHMHMVSIGLIVLLGISSVCSLIPAVLDILKLDTSAFSPVGTIVLNSINLVSLIIAVAFAPQSFINGFICLKEGITSHTVCSFAVIIAAIQSVTIYFNPEPTKLASYTFACAAILALYLCNEAERINIKRTIDVFKFCAFDQKDALYSIRPIENDPDAQEIGKSLNLKDPRILYSGKIDFPVNFLKNSKSSSFANSIVKRNFIISLIISIAVTVSAAFVSKDFFSAFSAFTASFCITAPASVLMSLSTALLRANRSLCGDGAAITSLESAQNCAQCDAAGIDCADLFCRGACQIEDVKYYGTVRFDDVLLYSVAMILQSGGPLSEVFNSIITGQREMLPPVKRLRYEEKLGLSARIYGHLVLMGTKEMMTKYEIDMPIISEENDCISSGKQLLYVSVDGIFAAVYVLKYVEDETLKDSLNELEDNGIRIIMRTDDPNVTEQFLSERFKLHSSSIRATLWKGSELFRWYRNSLKPNDNAGIMHDGNPYSYFRSIVIAQRINRFASVYKVFSLIAQLLLAALLLYAVFSGTWPILSAFTAIAFNLISLLVTNLIQKIKI